MEATGVYWKPVWHVLEGNFELVLGNAAHIKNVPGRKTDVNDATWIADLLAHGLIRSSFVPPRPVQELRDLTRTRKQLVREVAQHTLRIQKTLEDANVKLSSVISDVLGQSGRAILDAIVSGAAHLVSWAGLCPRNDESAGRRRSTRLRAGAPWLKTVLVQAAWAASRKKNSYFKAQFHRISMRRGPKKAVVAVAASMLTAAYHMLHRGVFYEDLGANHFDRRDKDKVAKRLIRRLEELGLKVEVKAAS
jgi:transposase